MFESSNFSEQKKQLIESYILEGYARNQWCINAFEKVPRSLFVPEELKEFCYQDRPLSIGYDQTISAPHMAFLECELIDLSPGDRLLEIGSGSGYHAAFCAEICAPLLPDNWSPCSSHFKEELYFEELKSEPVITMERKRALVKFASDNLKKAGYQERVKVIEGDGTEGYPPQAPYNKILVTAAAPGIPKPLIEQLAPGGKMIIPVGTRFSQKLQLVAKGKNGKISIQPGHGVVFVPLIGKFGW